MKLYYLVWRVCEVYTYPLADTTFTDLVVNQRIERYWLLGN